MCKDGEFHIQMLGVETTDFLSATHPVRPSYLAAITRLDFYPFRQQTKQACYIQQAIGEVTYTSYHDHSGEVW